MSAIANPIPAEQADAAGLREALAHPIDCTCTKCIAVFDLASDHRYDCRCDYCARWWEAMGPERD